MKVKIKLKIRGSVRVKSINQMRTLCDVCESAAAVFFCAVDEAALCHSCDDKVHTCNKLASRHVRVRLANPKVVPRCDICEKEPAFFYCEIDGTSLCLQCDMGVHVGGKRSHGRHLLFMQQIELQDSAWTPTDQGGRGMDSETALPSTSLGNQHMDTTPVINLNSNPPRLLEK